MPHQRLSLSAKLFQECMCYPTRCLMRQKDEKKWVEDSVEASKWLVELMGRLRAKEIESLGIVASSCWFKQTLALITRTSLDVYICIWVRFLSWKSRSQFSTRFSALRSSSKFIGDVLLTLTGALCYSMHRTLTALSSSMSWTLIDYTLSIFHPNKVKH